MVNIRKGLPNAWVLPNDRFANCWPFPLVVCRKCTHEQWFKKRPHYYWMILRINDIYSAGYVGRELCNDCSTTCICGWYTKIIMCHVTEIYKSALKVDFSSCKKQQQLDSIFTMLTDIPFLCKCRSIIVMWHEEFVNTWGWKGWNWYFSLQNTNNFRSSISLPLTFNT